jgi:glycerol-3-phosphate dehydrogenase
LVLPERTPDIQRVLAEYDSTLGPETVHHLQRRYGARWQRVADLALEQPSLRERIIGSEPDILAEVPYSRDYEMAVTFEDFLRRRTMLALKAPLLKNMERVQRAAELFGGPPVTAEQVALWQGIPK